MSKAIAVYHGEFGRATLYDLDRTLVTHAHREGHLIFYVGGAQCSLQIGDICQTLGPNNAGLVSPWEPHSFIVGQESSLSLALYIDAQWLLGVSQIAVPARITNPFIDMSEQAKALLAKICEEMLAGRFEQTLNQRIVQLTRACYEDVDSQDRQSVAGQPDPRISRSMRLLASKLEAGDKIDFKQIARDSGLSRPLFFKLFREQLGLTPNLYANTLRLEKAIEQLTETERPITSIGVDLGFASQPNFTRFFVSNVGVAPSTYRRKVRREDTGT